MSSLRSKIFLAVLVILGLMAGSVMTFSSREVRSTMVEAEERSAENVLRMAELAIRSQYSQLLADKVATIQSRKSEFRQFGRVVNGTLDSFAALAGAAGQSDETARAAALRWLAALEPVSGQYIVVFDRSGRALVYPDAAMVGEDLSSFRDIRGQSVVEAAWSESAQYGETFLTYMWKSLSSNALEAKYGYFAPFPRWGWMIATVGDVASLQRQTDLSRAALVEQLSRRFADIRMAGDGFVFIFRADDRMVVPPRRGADAWLSPAILGNLRALAPRDGALSPLTPVEAPAAPGPVAAQVFYLKALNWYVAAVISSDALEAPARGLVASQALVFGVGTLLSAVLAWIVATRITRPLLRLTRQAQRLATADFTKDTPPEFLAPPAGAMARSEVGRLAAAFSAMEGALHENVQSLMRVTRERERIEGELGVARDIQMGLLPVIFPAFPHRSEIDLYAALASAKEVGGDLYDFYFIDKHHLCFTIGDVAGKGVPAALFMAIAKTLIKAAADRNPDPTDMMRSVNNALASDNPNSIFVTCLIGILDCRTGRVAYANGGHNPPLVLRADGTVELLHDISGPALGVLDGIDFEPLETTLAVGDALLLYTDGVTEAMNSADALYSDERLLRLAERQDPLVPAEQLVRNIVADVRLHAGHAPQSDDITLLALRYLAPE